ncbi:hypothetical protein DFH07DRAFT_784677 [Mycena maculata]|uniref:Uncharacterized protein n=1 Tax=Mycena maculata TaxID=230809 RepID=A0AAD7HGM5_9AGAR|nr:hypothetical protein DFH07DRAFT_784677 [Mycena maculata]
MPPTPWATAEQRAFLDSEMPDFIQRQAEGKLHHFWVPMYSKYLARWPEQAHLNMPLPNDCTAPKLTPEELDWLGKATEARKEQLENWFRRNIGKATSAPAAASASIRAMFKKSPLKRCRAHQPVEIFQKHNPDLVKKALKEASYYVLAEDKTDGEKEGHKEGDTEGNEEGDKEGDTEGNEEGSREGDGEGGSEGGKPVTKTLRAQHMIRRKEVVVRLWAVEKVIKKEKEERVGKELKEEAASKEKATSPQALRKGVDALDQVYVDVHKATFNILGWVGMTIMGGELSMKITCFGQTAAGNDFEDVCIDFDKNIVKPFEAFLGLCFTAEECRATALPSPLPPREPGARVVREAVLPAVAPEVATKSKKTAWKKKTVESLLEGFTPIPSASAVPDDAGDSRGSVQWGLAVPALPLSPLWAFGKGDNVNVFVPSSPELGPVSDLECDEPPADLDLQSTRWPLGMGPPLSPDEAAELARIERGGTGDGGMMAIDPELTVLSGPLMASVSLSSPAHIMERPNPHGVFPAKAVCRVVHTTGTRARACCGRKVGWSARGCYLGSTEDGKSTRPKNAARGPCAIAHCTCRTTAAPLASSQNLDTIIPQSRPATKPPAVKKTAAKTKPEGARTAGSPTVPAPTAGTTSTEEPMVPTPDYANTVPSIPQSRPVTRPPVVKKTGAKNKEVADAAEGAPLGPRKRGRPRRVVDEVADEAATETAVAATTDAAPVGPTFSITNNNRAGAKQAAHFRQTYVGPILGFKESGGRTKRLKSTVEDQPWCHHGELLNLNSLTTGMASRSEIMDNMVLNVLNAPANLAEFEQSLKNYRKKKTEARKQFDRAHPGYKKNLEASIETCKLLIAQSTPNANAPTMAGSPNDPPITGTGKEPLTLGKGPHAFLDPALKAATNSQALQTRFDHRLFILLEPDIMGPTVFFKESGPPPKLIPIDPVFSENTNPGKRPLEEAGEDRPRHRKLPDPMVIATDAISARMLTDFTQGFGAHREELHATDPSSNAREFLQLDALEGVTELIMEKVLKAAEDAKIEHAKFKWEINWECGGDIEILHILQVHEWLVAVELMTRAPTVPAVPDGKRARSSKTNAPVVRIRNEDGKLVTFTDKMVFEARMDAARHPGCVEAGLEPVMAMMKNRSNKWKCITCDSGGPRGKALAGRPIPPREDRPFLEDCKCPVRGAALELWMIKMTAHDDSIPQRRRGDSSEGEGTRNRDLAMNPDILKLIGGAIKAASGHEVETLLQPEVDRLAHTITWALQRLGSIAEGEESKFTEHFGSLAQKFEELMQAIRRE